MTMILPNGRGGRGLSLAVAHDLFVHHFGSRTFVGNGVDAENLLDENAARFAVKWGNSVPRGVRVGLRAFSADPQNGRGKDVGPQMTQRDADGGPSKGRTAAESHEQAQAARAANGGRREPATAVHRGSSGLSADSRFRLGPASPAARARTSLTMIVRDEQDNLAERVSNPSRGLFDEIVVLDTGSRDRTIEIARSFGARVFDFVWVDDFAAARNAALARAKGDYAFWLDADDLIEPPEREAEELLEAVVGRPAKVDRHRRPWPEPVPICSAFVVRCKCDPGPDGSGGDTVVDHIRLFPLIEGVRWTYRVHEQILPALKRAGVPVEWTDITVRHTGYADRALRMRKLDRDARILHEELAERPDDPFTLFNLGSIAIERAEWNESLGYLKRSLAASAPSDSIVRKLYALIARSYQMLRDFPAALATLRRGACGSIPKTPSCCSARRSCIEVSARPRRRSNAGGES